MHAYKEECETRKECLQLFFPISSRLLVHQMCQPSYYLRLKLLCY